MVYKISSVFLAGLAIVIVTANVTSGNGILKLEPSYQNILRNVNDSLIVSCFIENHTELLVSWTEPNGKPIPVTTDRQIRKRVELISTSGRQYAKLILEDLNETDNGSYVCHHASRMSASFVLDIYESITFDETEKIQFAVIGTKYTVKCTPKLRGLANLRVFWKINNGSIDYTRMAPLSVGLLINKVYKNDSENVYLCTAMDLESKWPQVTRQSIRLIVLKENFTESQIYGARGKYVNLPCKANPLSKGSTIYTWYDSANQMIVPSHDNQMCFIETTNGNTLQVALKQDESFGTYKCLTENGNRTFAHKFQINEVETQNLENDDQIQGQCSPPLPTSTQNPGHESVSPVVSSNDLLDDLVNEDFMRINESITTTKKSTTTTTTTKVNTIINEDGSTTVKTTIISESEETTIVTTGKDN